MYVEIVVGGVYVHMVDGGVYVILLVPEVGTVYMVGVVAGSGELLKLQLNGICAVVVGSTTLGGEVGAQT